MTSLKHKVLEPLKPWYQRGDKPCNEKFLRRCPCRSCRAQRIHRLIAGAATFLNLYRNELNRLQDKPAHIPSWRVKSDGGYAARETNDQWGAL